MIRVVKLEWEGHVAYYRDVELAFDELRLLWDTDQYAEVEVTFTWMDADGLERIVGE